MRLHDPDSHYKYVGMSKVMFDTLLQEVDYVVSNVHWIKKMFLCIKVSPHFGKKSYCSKIRVDIPPAERLALTVQIFSHWIFSSTINVYSMSSVCYPNIC